MPRTRVTFPQDFDVSAGTSPIRVGFVLHAMQVAGAEVLVKETIHRLGARIVPTVFCLDSIGPLGHQLQDEGTDVVCLNRKPGRDWGVAWRLAQAIRERELDVLHAHQYSPFFYAALASRLCGSRPRVILTEHGRHFPDCVSAVRRAVNRLVLDRLADAVNAVCAFSARSLCRIDGFSGERIEIIENGIDVERYAPVSDRAALRRRLGLSPTRRYVANVARLHPVKDQASLVRAFARIAAETADVDLLLVGDGSLRRSLEDLVDELGIRPRIHFLGVRSDVPDILRAVDIFALTSVSEAASLTLLEAMAAGLPVVVTAVGGNPEIVRHECEGLLVPRADVPAMTDALRDLLANPDRARELGAAGRARVWRRFQLKYTVEAYGRLYERLCGSRRKND
ncbi:MAG: glycosyltransferase [Gemmataceae bacterium]|nr:glycosyltransferase [Gemmataceae bacterium]